MRLISDISLKLIQGKAADGLWDPKCEILVHRKPTGKHIDGAILQATVQWQNKILLFVTYDCLFAEELSVLLLDSQLNPIDQVLIGAECSSCFKSLELIEPDTLRFYFLGENPWEIQLLSKQKGRIPFISEPSFVSRPFGFTKQFIVRGNPMPPCSFNPGCVTISAFVGGALAAFGMDYLFWLSSCT